MNGVVVAGTRSGVGKTVATLAAIRALERAGETVQPAKAGPDFVDPSHHAAAAGRPSRTLDPWLQGTDGLRRNYRRGEGSVCVVEGMMGLYDGDAASTAAVAAALDLPVVLVVDAAASMESVAATALGFREYGDVEVAGVLAQRAHGGRHAEGIESALPDGLDYLGRIPPAERLEIPDRHLGLELGTESPVPDAALDEAAGTVDAGGLLSLAREPPPPDTDAGRGNGQTGARVAVATGRGFEFCYPATRERLRERATVRPFAPADGEDLPDCDAVYLPGGYPELVAAELAAGPALASLARVAADGTPILGECGGLLALCERLDTDGGSHEMAGVLPAEVRMCDRHQALDHVKLRARQDTLTAGAGGRLRGHEFHHSTATVGGDARFAFETVRGEGITGDRDGLTEYRTLGTYCHCHPESGAFDALVEGV